MLPFRFVDNVPENTCQRYAKLETTCKNFSPLFMIYFVYKLPALFRMHASLLSHPFLVKFCLSNDDLPSSIINFSRSISLFKIRQDVEEKKIIRTFLTFYHFTENNLTCPARNVFSLSWKNRTEISPSIHWRNENWKFHARKENDTFRFDPYCVRAHVDSWRILHKENQVVNHCMWATLPQVGQAIP